MSLRKLCGRIAIVFFVLASSVFAIEPVDPDLIPAGRNILNYFESIYKTKTISAARKSNGVTEAIRCSGKRPVIMEEDLCGWDPSGKWSDTYKKNIQRQINALEDHWNEGGIVGLCWHWPSTEQNLGGFDHSQLNAPVGKIVTPGTPENKRMMEDLAKHVDYVEQLANKNIPVLWRPLHEIDGGWFWWTDENNGENTAKLWRIIYDYMVNERGLHNLIWVYSTGVGHPSRRPLDYRKEYYPGAEFVDLAGIDWYDLSSKDPSQTIYGKGYHDYWDGPYTFQDIFDMMSQVCPGKMLALTEVAACPDWSKLVGGDSNFAPWLYALPWYMGGGRNPCDWVKKTYDHSFVITQESLPDLRNGIDPPEPTAPNARLDINTTSGYAPLTIDCDASLSGGLGISYAWSVDGTPKSTETTFSYTFDDTGAYTLDLVVSNSAGSDTETVSITVYDMSTPLPSTTLNDNQTGSGVNQISYAGNWNSGASSGAYQDDEHWTGTSGASFTILFYGTQMKLYATTNAHHGIAEVSIDGGEPVDVDLYSSDRTPQALVYTSPELSMGPHTITVTNSGRHNSAATGNTIVLDKAAISGDDAVYSRHNLSQPGVSSFSRKHAPSADYFDMRGRRIRVGTHSLGNASLPDGTYLVRTDKGIRKLIAPINK